MKTLLFISLLMFTTCSIPPDKGYDSARDGNYKRKDSFAVNGYKIDVIKYDGHEYILVQNGRNAGGAVAIIHSESCPCKKSFKVNN